MSLEELEVLNILVEATNYIVEMRYCMGGASREEYMAAAADLLDELSTNIRSNIQGTVHVPARRDA